MSDNQTVDIAKEINDVVDRLKPLLEAVADGLQLRDIGVFAKDLPPFIDEILDFFNKAGQEYAEVREKAEELREVWERKRSNPR